MSVITFKYLLIKILNLVKIMFKYQTFSFLGDRLKICFDSMAAYSSGTCFLGLVEKVLLEIKMSLLLEFFLLFDRFLELLSELFLSFEDLVVKIDTLISHHLLDFFNVSEHLRSKVVQLFQCFFVLLL